MSVRFPRLTLLLALAAPLFLPWTPARAEDEPEKPKAEPETPKAEPEKPKKKETDDTSIFADWKLCKARGAKHCRTRAEFWTGKGTSGKDLFALGLMWNRGEDYAKAADVLGQFMEWKPDPGNQKAVEDNAKNREYAGHELVSIYFKAKEYAKSIAAAVKFREDFPNSQVLVETWDFQGRAHRMAGEEDKAVEAFTKALEGKLVNGLFDLVDLHVCAGNLDAAKAAFGKFDMDNAKGRDKLIIQLKEFVDLIGTAAPTLEGTFNVGTGEAPTKWDKPTIMLYWAQQTGNADRRLENIEKLRRSFGASVNAVGISTYNHYNVETMKVEAALTEEQERDGYKKLISQSPANLPSMLVVPKEFLEAAKVKYEGQVVIVDGEGKLRYMRVTDTTPYDLNCMDLMLKKLTGAAAPGGDKPAGDKPAGDKPEGDK